MWLESQNHTCKHPTKHYILLKTRNLISDIKSKYKGLNTWFEPNRRDNLNKQCCMTHYRSDLPNIWVETDYTFEKKT